ncbi:NAD(P)/FAD-dependent oxidoreductase [Amedibacillus sp. YH-ame6]
MIRIQQLKLSLDEELTILPIKIVKKLRIPEEELLSYHIVKESIDARKAEDIHFTYTVDCKVANETKLLKYKMKDVSKAVKERYHMPKKGVVGLKHRPIVIGFGPAGMFSALLLAQLGYQPLVLERGECVEKRVESVERFWKEGILNPSSNVQFGEGGAGTFSDGKLTTRVKDTRIIKILEELVRFGAPEEILYQAHPHIGTDYLRNIVKQMREEIIRLGGEIRFETKVEDFVIEQGELVKVIANGEEIPCEQAILAIGHSARDTFETLMDRGFCIHAKAFAIGARIEHPQTLINQAQYKQHANHPRLKAADYRLVHTASNGRGVYTFCMCPGGSVVPSTSIEGGVVVNGMSEHARDQENANSAVLVQVRTSDFDDDPRKGIQLQSDIEKKAYQLAGSNYHAPVQLVKDFLAGNPSTTLGSVTPSYALGVTPCNLLDILPEYVGKAMQEGIVNFDRKIKGFAMDDAILTGVETRSSSPLRIEREKDTCNCISVKGVYPCGEGAGYAGGIVSAAIDGLRCAEKLIELYQYEKK